MRSFFIPVPEADQEDEKQFEERDEEEAVRRAENFNDGAHEKTSERGASEKYEGVEAHDAAQVIRRAGQLDRGVAVDHEKNDGKSDKSEDQERRDAESVNAAVQDAVGKERAIGAEIQDESAYDGHGEEIAPDDRILFRIEQAFPDLRQSAFFLFLRGRLIHLHEVVGQKDRNQGNRVQEKYGAVVDVRKEKSSEQRPEHAGDVEIGGIQRDGAVELSPTHEKRHEGRAASASAWRI